MAGLQPEIEDDFLQKLGEKSTYRQSTAADSSTRCTSSSWACIRTASSAETTGTQFADFTIVNCGQEYKVHRLVLGVHSTYVNRLSKSCFVVTVLHIASGVGHSNVRAI
ncbi:hypothetical protein M409DRAFT_25530 [Zasmidium cellare ATCC 36951]|uniref:BTB domain-containing protein n=1 Tax=Zasmidium cellare ATCC 36951 TaxID=1080233 RepID=A0A6A6CAY1_ZASCE|nr:uncharacterized protein M409DRAFT_25530 [Zasmidium cellare ATCC 36951]KAF2164185.1 hypothetical protein M409DRAFT_25530 [Zasmidium cellare ATCC 36951]